jgi:hypothetical protein
LELVSAENLAFERRLPDGVFEQLLEIVVTDKLAATGYCTGYAAKSPTHCVGIHLQRQL